MAVLAGDDRPPDMIRHRLQPQREARVDHRHDPTAQRGQPPDRGFDARHVHHVADIDHGIDLIGVEHHTLPVDTGDQEQRHQRPPRRA